MTWPRLGRTRRWAADCRPQGWSPAVVRGDGDACRCVPLPDMSCLPGSISGASFLSRHTPRRGESSASNNLNHDRSGRFAVPKARFRGVQKTRHGPATPSGRRAPPSQPYGLPQMGGPSRSSILPCQLVLWERRPVPCAADRREGILQSRRNSFSCRRGTEGPNGEVCLQIANSALPIPPSAKRRPQSRPSPSHFLTLGLGPGGRAALKGSNGGRAGTKLRRRHD